MEPIGNLFRTIFGELIWFAMKIILGGIQILAGVASDAFTDWRNARQRRRDKFKKQTEGKAGHVLGIRHPDKH